MDKKFSSVLQFRVKPDKPEEFEQLITNIRTQQETMDGHPDMKIMKRFYTFDDVNSGEPPRELTRVVKCIKYYAFLEFKTIEDSGRYMAWLFDNHGKQIMKLLISPFDIMNGYEL